MKIAEGSFVFAQGWKRRPAGTEKTWVVGRVNAVDALNETTMTSYASNLKRLADSSSIRLLGIKKEPLWDTTNIITKKQAEKYKLLNDV
jgi:hypothetical protein